MNESSGDRLTELLATVEVFRRALEVTTELSHPGFRQFPRGACGESSGLLGEFLRERGFGEWTYRWSVRYEPDHQSHAWIEQGDVVVDITADQFEEIDKPVVIAVN